MKHLLVALVIVSLGALVGCASKGRDVIVDTDHIDQVQYEKDLHACKRFAAQVKDKAGERAVKGAVVGGLFGAIFGGKDAAKKGASAGAVSGASRGAAETKHERLHVIKKCLRNRGYAVLN